MRLAFSFVLPLFLISGCDLPSSLSGTDFAEIYEEEERLRREERYQDALDILFDLGIYGFDPAMQTGCDQENLRPLNEQAELPKSVAQRLKYLIEGMSGDEVFNYMLNLNALTAQELVEALDLRASRSKDLRDPVTLWLILEAAERQSVEALNEIGAALTYCYFDVAQNIPAAIDALEQAVKLGDPLAKLTLGKLLYSDLSEESDRARGMALQDEAFEQTVLALRQSRDTFKPSE